MSAPTYDPVADDSIVDWRRACFETLGFTTLHAYALAIRKDVDRVVVERLIMAGAKPRTVAEIVL